MLGGVKPGVVSQPVGKQTIVIAAPKSGAGPGGATPTKILTTMPRLSTPNTSGQTQFIVVTTRPGGTGTVQQVAGQSKYTLVITSARDIEQWHGYSIEAFWYQVTVIIPCDGPQN